MCVRSAVGGSTFPCSTCERYVGLIPTISANFRSVMPFVNRDFAEHLAECRSNLGHDDARYFMRERTLFATTRNFCKKLLDYGSYRDSMTKPVYLLRIRFTVLVSTLGTNLMLAKIADFKWYIYSGGYECENSPDGKARLLAPNVLKAISDGIEVRRPLEDEPALHRKFAALEHTEVAIVSFANQWGPLTAEHEFWEDPELDENITDFSWRCESTETWFAKIRRMKAAVDLWDAVKDGAQIKLADVVDFSATKDEYSWHVRICFKHAPELWWNHSFDKSNSPGFFSLIGRGAERIVSRMRLVDLINEALWGTCSPGLGDGAKHDGLQLLFGPHNLEAAMWLLFIQEVLGQKTFKQCVVCNGHFEVRCDEGARRGRIDKKYCSAKCRAAAFRDRKEVEPKGSTNSKKSDRKAQGTKDGTKGQK